MEVLGKIGEFDSDNVFDSSIISSFIHSWKRLLKRFIVQY